MSSFDLNILNDKNMEQLYEVNENLLMKRNELEMERIKITKQLTEIKKNISKIDDEYKFNLDEIHRRRSIEEAQNIIGENERSIEGFELLKEDELSIIVKNMDKTDYIKWGNYPRWLDLVTLIEYVIKIKKQYSGWELVNLTKCGQDDTMPPENIYKYEFKDVYENYFNIGGIDIIN
jgi:hypothetical protein